MAQDRRMVVLRAVVEDYIRTQEPVGSSALAKNHQLGVSSATIRNDMAALEEEGYLTQPHTSAGRVPTDKGYRTFVDRLATVVPLSQAQRDGIRTFLSGSVDLDDVLRRAARLLAQITGQVAVVAAPSPARSRLRHLELVPLGPHTILLVIIGDTGRVEQRTLSVHEELSMDMLAALSKTINAHNAEQPLKYVAGQLHALQVPHQQQELVLAIAHVCEELAAQEQSNQIYMAGASQLTHTHTVDLTTIRPLLDALEEQMVVMKLMTTLAQVSQSHGVGVAIGAETQTPGLLHASVVTSGYGLSNVAYDDVADGSNVGSSMSSDGYQQRTPDRVHNIEDSGQTQQHTDAADATTHPTGEPLAVIGSIGPTHMDYATTIAAVRAVAMYLTDFMGDA